MAQEDSTTLVLGGKGKTGPRVVERLDGQGIPVRVGARSGQPHSHWDDETTRAPVLTWTPEVDR